MQAMEERIAEILHDKFKVPRPTMQPDTTLADISFDSLIIVELILVLGNEFGVVLDDDELQDKMTVADIASVLHAKGAVT